MEELLLTFGLHDGREIPWLDLLGTFLFMAGFVIGLGGVTVIDFHAWLGRHSEYWTEATTRTHKVTKPLIWAGLFIALLGAGIIYRNTGLSGIALIQAIVAFVLVINGLYLTFSVSPFLLRREREGHSKEILPARLQSSVMVSFLISLVGWWFELFLFTWYLLVLR